MLSAHSAADSSSYMRPHFLIVSTHNPQIKPSAFQIHWKVDCLGFKLSFLKKPILEMMKWVCVQVSLEEKVLIVPLVPLASKASRAKGLVGKPEGQGCRPICGGHMPQRGAVTCRVGERPSGTTFRRRSILGSWQWGGIVGEGLSVSREAPERQSGQMGLPVSARGPTCKSWRESALRTVRNYKVCPNICLLNCLRLREKENL